MGKVCEDLLNEYDGMEWGPVIEQKYLTDDGQMFLFCVAPVYGGGTYKNTLIRAFIPEEGFPVKLSHNGVQKDLSNKKSFEKYLWDKVLENDDMVAFLRGFKSIDRLHNE